EAEADTQNIIYMNRSAQNILGYPAEAWHKPGFWGEHIHAEDRERVTNELARLARRQPSPLQRVGEQPPTEEPPRAWPGGADGARAILEFRMIAADRRILWLHCTFALREVEGKKRLYGYGV